MLNRVSGSLQEYRNAEQKYKQAGKNLNRAHKESRNSGYFGGPTPLHKALFEKQVKLHRKFVVAMKRYLHLARNFIKRTQENGGERIHGNRNEFLTNAEKKYIRNYANYVKSISSLKRHRAAASRQPNASPLFRNLPPNINRKIKANLKKSLLTQLRSNTWRLEF